MRMKHNGYLGIRTKIILCTVFCVVAVGLVSNIALYRYMQAIISEKVSSIDNLYANTIAAQLDASLEKAIALNSYCANSEDVAEALRGSSLQTSVARTAAMRAQNAMNSYLRGAGVEPYVNKLLIFNERGMIVHALSIQTGGAYDLQRILESEQFLQWQQAEDAPAFCRLYPSVNTARNDCFVLITPVYSPGYSTRIGYVYTEISPDIVTDILLPYNQLNKIFLQTQAGDLMMPDRNEAFLTAYSEAEQDGHFRFDKSLYHEQLYPLRPDALTLVSCINQSDLMASNQNILYSIIMVAIMILLIVIAVLVILTHYITQPVKLIMDKINRISLNDYSFDPQLEHKRSEMGEIGARLNELGLGFEKLLEETIALHDQRKQIEMALLQSQVNPHFLYNTLNSIQWMATVQKNPGVVEITRSLVNLLKNISKGVSARITIAEELALLGDYITIQSIRYLETFDYLCSVPDALRGYTIPKLTLQPIVENAIFHGVVPKGTFGVITVDGHEEGEWLVLTVSDDGVGMTQKEIDALLTSGRNVDQSSMSGIGVANVHQRLQLTYGREAGLKIHSEQEKGTCVRVRIRKEC